MRLLRALLALVVLVLVAGAEVASAWTTRIAGVESIDDQVRDVASDPSGDLIVVDDDSVAKHARADGAPLWRTRVVENANTVNFIGGVTVDAAGDVVVIGIVAELGALTDALVVKLSGADGRELWRHRYDGPANRSDYATDVAIDPNGDVIVGGVTHFIAEDMLALKLDGRTGALKWQAVIAGLGVGQDQVLAVAVDANGDVALAGDSTVGTENYFAAVKLRGTNGTILWRATAGAGDENGQATAVAFDPAGDIVVVGSIAFDATGFDVAVVKLAGATGAEQWHHYVDGSAHAFDFGSDVAIDAAGRITAVGRVVEQDTGADLLVLELAPDGSELWTRVVDGGAGGYDDVDAVAIVGDRIVVAASIDGTSFDTTRFAVLGFDAATGAEVWRHVRDGDAGARDQATDVVAGSGGQVLVAGELANVGTKNDGLVLAIDAASGVEQWERTLNVTIPEVDDRAQSVAVDAHGNAIVAGTIGTEQTAEDFTVVKLTAAGTEAWRARIDGALHANDAGGPVAVAPDGAVFAAGTTVDGPGLPPTDPRFPGPPPLTNVTVVKLDGATGAETWRSAPAFPGRGVAPAATDLALAGEDVVVGGWFGTSAFQSSSAVVKLRGSDGAELWRKLFFLDLFPEVPVRVEVDGAGDVVATSQGSVAKLRGSDGGTLWGPVNALLAAHALAVDQQGDVLVAGEHVAGFVVTKLRGSNGTTAWSASLGPGRALAVQVDASGDAIATGVLSVRDAERIVVVKLDGDDGSVVWSRVAPLRAPAEGTALALDASGNAFVGGFATMAGRRENVAVLKLRGDNGRIVWRRLVDGRARADDRAHAIALDAAGNPFVAGVLRGPGSDGDFAVIRFDHRSGRYR